MRLLFFEIFLISILCSIVCSIKYVRIKVENPDGTVWYLTAENENEFKTGVDFDYNQDSIVDYQFTITADQQTGEIFVYDMNGHEADEILTEYFRTSIFRCNTNKTKINLLYWYSGNTFFTERILEEIIWAKVEKSDKMEFINKNNISFEVKKITKSAKPSLYTNKNNDQQKFFVAVHMKMKTNLYLIPLEQFDLNDTIQALEDYAKMIEEAERFIWNKVEKSGKMEFIKKNKVTFKVKEVTNESTKPSLYANNNDQQKFFVSVHMKMKPNPYVIPLEQFDVNDTIQALEDYAKMSEYIEETNRYTYGTQNKSTSSKVQSFFNKMIENLTSDTSYEPEQMIEITNLLNILKSKMLKNRRENQNMMNKLNEYISIAMNLKRESPNILTFNLKYWIEKFRLMAEKLGDGNFIEKICKKDLGTILAPFKNLGQLVESKYFRKFFNLKNLIELFQYISDISTIVNKYYANYGTLLIDPTKSGIQETLREMGLNKIKEIRRKVGGNGKIHDPFNDKLSTITNIITALYNNIGIQKTLFFETIKKIFNDKEWLKKQNIDEILKFEKIMNDVYQLPVNELIYSGYDTNIDDILDLIAERKVQFNDDEKVDPKKFITYFQDFFDRFLKNTEHKDFVRSEKTTSLWKLSEALLPYTKNLQWLNRASLKQIGHLKGSLKEMQSRVHKLYRRKANGEKDEKIWISSAAAAVIDSLLVGSEKNITEHIKKRQDNRIYEFLNSKYYSDAEKIVDIAGFMSERVRACNKEIDDKINPNTLMKIFDMIDIHMKDCDWLIYEKTNTIAELGLMLNKVLDDIKSTKPYSEVMKDDIYEITEVIRRCLIYANDRVYFDHIHKLIKTYNPSFVPQSWTQVREENKKIHDILKNRKMEKIIEEARIKYAKKDYAKTAVLLNKLTLYGLKLNENDNFIRTQDIINIKENNPHMFRGLLNVAHY